MTASHRLAWLACYASAWFHAPSRISCGVVHDHERAAVAAAEADRMVAALRVERPEVVVDLPEQGAADTEVLA